MDGKNLEPKPIVAVSEYDAASHTNQAEITTILRRNVLGITCTYPQQRKSNLLLNGVPRTFVNKLLSDKDCTNLKQAAEAINVNQKNC